MDHVGVGSRGPGGKENRQPEYYHGIKRAGIQVLLESDETAWARFASRAERYAKLPKSIRAGPAEGPEPPGIFSPISAGFGQETVMRVRLLRVRHCA